MSGRRRQISMVKLPERMGMNHEISSELREAGASGSRAYAGRHAGQRQALRNRRKIPPIRAFAASASQLKAQERAGPCRDSRGGALNMIEQSKAALSETEKDFAQRLETFGAHVKRAESSSRHHRPGCGSTAEGVEGSRGQGLGPEWSDTWAQSWTEMHRSAMETLDRFRDWIAKQSGSDDQTETPV